MLTDKKQTEFERLLKDPVLSQKLITAAREGIVKWELWLEGSRTARTVTELELHEMSIRYAKGVVKLWRIWLTRQPRINDKASSTNGALSS